MGKQRTRFQQIEGQGGSMLSNVLRSKNYQENIAKNYVKEQEDLEAELLLEQIKKEEIQKQLLAEQKLKEEAEKYAPQDEEDILLQQNLDENSYKDIKNTKNRIKELEKKTFAGRVGIAFDELWDWMQYSGIGTNFLKKETLSSEEEIEYNSLLDKKYKIQAPIIKNQNEKQTQPLKKEIELLYKEQQDKNYKTRISNNSLTEEEKNDFYKTTKNGFVRKNSIKDHKEEILLGRALTLLEHKDEREKDYLSTTPNNWKEGKFINNLGNSIANTFDGLGNQSEEYASLGLISMLDQSLYDSIRKKIENKENLSIAEEKFRQAIDLFKKAKQEVRPESYMYNLGDDSRESVVMMEQTIATQLAMNAIAPGSGAIQLLGKTSKAWKGMNALQKTIAIGKNVASVGVQTAITPATYKMANELQNDAIEKIIDVDGNEKWLVLDSDKITEAKKLTNAIVNETNKIDKLSNLFSTGKITPEQNKELELSLKRRAFLFENKMELVDENNNIRNKQYSESDAFIHGYIEMYKENASEVFVGEAASKLFPAIGSALKSLDSKALKIGEKAFAKKIGKGIDKIRKGYDDFLNAANKNILENNRLGLLSKAAVNHTGAAKLIHGLPGEYIEEVAINLTPSYIRDYDEQLKELYNFSTDAQGKKVDSIFDSQAFDWHSKVLGQSALIGFLFGGGGKVIEGLQHQGNMVFNNDYKIQYDNYIKNRKLLSDLYSRVDNTIDDAQLAQDIAMSTLGSIFQTSDYNARIGTLRNEKFDHKDGLTQKERNKKADLMERNAFFNLGTQSINTGTSKQYKKTLDRLSKNEKVSEQTRTNALIGLKKFNEIEEIAEMYSGRINSQILQDLAIRENFNKVTIEDLTKKIEETKKTATKQIEDFLIGENLEKNFFDIENIHKSENDFVNQEDYLMYETKKTELFEANLPAVNDYLYNTGVKNILQYENNQVINKLYSELNPANQELIKNRELDKLKKQLVSNVTVNNVEKVKTELKEKGIETPDFVQKINDKVIASTDILPVNNVIGTSEEIITPVNIEEDFSISEFLSSNISLADFNESPSEEKVILNNIQGFPQPLPRDENSEPQNKIVEKLTDSFKKQLEKYPNISFDRMMISISDKIGDVQIDKGFNFYAEAWNKATDNSLSQNQIQESYQKLFGNIEKNNDFSIDNIESKESNPTIETPAIQKSLETLTVKLNPITEKIEIVYKGRKYADIGLKAGFLGLNYKEVDGKKETTSTIVNENALSFIDPRNFNVGDEVELLFDFEFFLNKNNNINIWNNLDGNPIKNTVNIVEFLNYIFPSKTYQEIVVLLQTNPQILLENEDFLKSIPIGVKNNGQYNTELEIIPGALNDYNWFNKANVALIEDNKEEQENRIKENRKLNLETRKQIASKGIVKVKVKEKRNGQDNTLLKENEDVSPIFQSLFEAHRKKEANVAEKEHNEEIKSKTAIGVIRNGQVQGELDKLITVNGQEVSLDNITNWKNFVKNIEETGETISGRVVYVVQNGVDVNNKPKYIIHNVINNHLEKNKPNGSFQTQFNIKFKLNEYRMILNGVDKDGNKIVYSASQIEKAQKIRENIKSKFKIDIKFKEVVDEINGFYPNETKSQKSKNEGKRFKQDYNPRLASEKKFKEGIPNLLIYNSVNEFEDAFVKGNIESITYTDILYNNIHTNLIYTPVTNTEGKTVWTSEVQPVIIYTNSHIEKEKEIDVQIDNKKEFDILQSEIENKFKILAQLDNVEDKKDYDEILTDIKNLQKKQKVLKENLIKSEQQPTISKAETQKSEEGSVGVWGDKIKIDPDLTNIDPTIQAARNGDKQAQKKLEEYGLDWEQTTTYRFVGQSEVDVLLSDNKVESKRFTDAGIDVTTSDKVTSAANNEYRVTFKESFDVNNGLGKVKIKSKEEGDHNLEKGRGYDINDVAKIERIDENGNVIEVLYEQSLKETTKAETTPDTFNQPEIKEFTDTDAFQVVEHIVYNALGTLDMTGEINKQNIYKEVIKHYYELIDRLTNENKTQELEFVKENKDEILGLNGNYDNSIRELVDVLLKLDENTDIIASDLIDENIKDVNKESYEQVMSLSMKIKLLLSGVKATNSEVNNQENFGGLETMMSLSDTIDALQQMLSKTENNTLESLKKTIEEKQKINPKEFQFYTEILEKLDRINKIDSSVINKILYNLWQPEVKMSFVMFKKNANDTYSMELMDANSKNPLFIKRQKWNESFKNSPLIEKYNEGFYKTNKEGQQKYNELFKQLKENKTKENLDELLKFIGIKLNKKLLEDSFNPASTNYKLYNDLLFDDKGIINNLNNNVNKFNQIDVLNNNVDKLTQTSYNKIVNQIFNKKTFLTDKKLNELIEKNKTNNPNKIKQLELVFNSNSIDNKEFQKQFELLTFDNSRINDLIKLDNNLSFIPGNMMYLAGKMINIRKNPEHISNTLKELKGDGNLINDLLSSQISKDNFVLNLIKNNPELKDYIDVIMIGLEALKEKGTQSEDNNSITKLSSKDAFLTLFNSFAHTEGKIINEDLKNMGIKIRKGLINFPTISDSSQLPLFKTILIDIQKQNLENNNISEDLMDIMINQLVKGDLLRTGAFLKNGASTNIKGADAGSLHITGIMSLNTVPVNFSYTISEKVIDTKRTLIEVFRNNPKYHTEQGVQEFIKEFKEDIIKEINRNIQYEVNQFISEDGLSGMFVDNDIYNSEEAKLNYIDEKYLETKKETQGLEKARLIAFDYVINNFIQQKEIQTTFAGDIANYFKDNMIDNMIHGRSVTTKENIINYYYKDFKKQIKELENTKDFETLFERFPQLKFSNEYITSDIKHEEQYQEVMIPIAQMKMKKVFKDVSDNLSKRLKVLISPGNQFSNSKSHKIYKQLMVKDVENSSEVLDYLLKLNYPNLYDEYIDRIREFKTLDNIYPNNRNSKQTLRHKELLNGNKKTKGLLELLPKIAGFLKTVSTDAQEYVSWKDNLNQLLDQGRIFEKDYNQLVKKFNAQEKDLDTIGYIKEENKLTYEENKMATLQPSKPMYGGLHFEDFGDYKAQRFIYIKSSSFAITPEMAAFFPKLNQLRKTINKLQSKDVVVRISYDSANKVGAVKNAISMSDLFKDNIDMKKVKASTVILDRKNFYIQQDKPYVADLKDTSRATQFEKIILGDGINKIVKKVFPNMFDTELLNEAKIEVINGKISGTDLDKLYKLFYQKEQKIVKDELFRKLGITQYKDIDNKNYIIMEKLVKIINKRLTNKQDKKFLELVYTVTEKEYEGYKFTAKEIEDRKLTKNTAEVKMPLMMTPNSKKFESVLGSVINNNSINLKSLGGSSPVASQQNFDFKDFDEFDLDKLKKQGLVTTPNFDPKVGLKATTLFDKNGNKVLDEKGQPILQYAQVFLPNKFRIFNKKTGENELINLKDFTNEQRQIDFDKIPKDLLSMFSFRIPTSSHQSGVVIEVVGFLPDNMGDLMIVSKDHTVQIGEDYDIDTRYFYNYHYIKTADGKLKKLEYSDIPNLNKSLIELKEELEQYKKQLFDDYWNVNTNVDTPLSKFKFIKNNQWLNNKELLLEIAVLENSLENYSEDKLLHAIFQEDYDFAPIASKEEMQDKIEELKSKLVSKDVVKKEAKRLKNEYYNIIKDLKEAYQNEKSGLKSAYINYGGVLQVEKDKKRVLENNIISIYKTVFSTTDNEVQNLINKTLSTEFPENTSNYMDNELSNSQDNIFNIYSASTQAKIMTLGADGKTGIAIHSNFVTQNSLFQQFANIDSNNNSDIKFVKYYDRETGQPVFYDIKLGTMTFDGQLGKVFSNNGFRISESAMQSQNCATDNQKLGVMGRRNENSETINVFAILQANGLDNEGVIVNGENLSYASMFINQPIIREYVELLKKNKSLTNEKELDALEIIKSKYEKEIPKTSWVINNKKPVIGKFTNEKLLELGKNLTSQKLADGLKTVEFDIENQLYVLDVFEQLKKPAREYNRLQKFINIESGGVGKSYFDTIELMNEMIFIASGRIDITRSSEMIGDFKTIINDDKKTIKKIESEGYIFIKEKKGFNFYIKPSTHYGHKIVNSIANSYNLWQSIFPYESKIINDQIETILYNIPDLNKDAIRELKYNIIEQLKDYIFSDNKTLFGRNSEIENKKLFFDTKNNTSLSKYLLELSKTDGYGHIFKLPFFRNLDFIMGSEEFPSILKYSVNNIETIDIFNVYNTLNRFVNSDKQLPKKDGIEYKESDLMKDLLMYSLLANQGNGAIGFRHLLPTELFDKYNVPLTVRNKTGNESLLIQNVTYNGIMKSMENLLNSKINEEGTIINNGYNIQDVIALVDKINFSINENKGTKNIIYATSNNNGDITFIGANNDFINSTFVRQYFQHNYKLLPTILYNKNSDYLNESKLFLLLQKNGFNFENFDDGLVTEFDYDIEQNFITIQDKNGKKRLYERISDKRFKQIPTLGTFGMNEYNSGQKIEKSLIKKNNPKVLFQKPVNLEFTENETFSINKMQLEINNILNNPGTYKDLLKLLTPLVDFSKVKLLEGNITGAAQYNADDNTIIINTTYLKNENLTKEQFQKTIVEEMLHHITVTTMKKYVDFKNAPIDTNGKLTYTIAENTPASLRTMMLVYQQAVDILVKEQGLNTVLKTINNFSNIANNNESNSLQFQNDNVDNVYRITNIHEFIAGIFIKDTDFARKMSNIQYLKSDKSILEKFVESLGKIFTSILPGAKKDSISAQTLQSLLEFLQEENGKKIEIKPYYESTYNNEANNKAMNEAQNLLDESSNVNENTLKKETASVTNNQNVKREEISSKVESQELPNDIKLIKASKKSNYISKTFDGRSILKSGYLVTIPNLPNVKLFLTQETASQESTDLTNEFNIKSKEWFIEIEHPIKGFMTVPKLNRFVTNLQDTLEEVEKNINKQIKLEQGSKVLKDVGIVINTNQNVTNNQNTQVQDDFTEPCNGGASI